MTGKGRALVLLRHAKSSAPDALPDRERPLTGRGRRDAQAAGEALLRAGIAPDLVCCSTAVRARETWEGVAAAGVPAGEVVYTDRIYEASAGALAELVRDAPESVRTLLLVGHAPGVPRLAELLAGDGSDPEALARMRAGYPTSGLAALELDDPWNPPHPLDGGTARLLRFEVPRG